MKPSPPPRLDWRVALFLFVVAAIGLAMVGALLLGGLAAVMT